MCLVFFVYKEVNEIKGMFGSIILEGIGGKNLSF